MKKANKILYWKCGNRFFKACYDEDEEQIPELQAPIELHDFLPFLVRNQDFIRADVEIEFLRGAEV